MVNSGELDKDSGVRSIATALRLLQIVGEAARPLRIRELADLALIPRATVYRLVGTLLQEGYLLQDPDDQRLSIGYYVLPLAGSLLDKHRIRAAALPCMEELSKTAAIKVTLAAMYRGKIFTLGVVERPDLPQIHSYFGVITPPHCCGLGKAILAYMDRARVEEIVEASPLIARTENTITEFSRLEQELDQVRNQGYAVDNAEGALHQYCVAAAIAPRDGPPIAAISITKKTLNDVLVHREELLRCAERISHLL